METKLEREKYFVSKIIFSSFLIFSLLSFDILKLLDILTIF